MLIAHAAPAAADPAPAIYAESFQSGSAAGWAARGPGEVRLSTFAGNVSLALTGQAEAVHSQPAGARRLFIGMSMAAKGLQPGQACIGDVSSPGQPWRTVVRVGASGADAVTLHKGRIGFEASGGEVVLRARSPEGEAACWLDDVTVEAAPDAVAELDERVLDGALPFSTPVLMAGLAPPADARPPQAPVSGRLRLSLHEPLAGFRTLRDDTPEPSPDRRRTLPDLEIDLVSDGGALIPVQRGVIAAGHPEWDWIVEPGSIWRTADGLRAVLPVALQERNANCVHNGVLSFDLRPDGRSSRAVLEIAGETCRYFRFDLWARLDASFTAEPPPAGVAEAYRREVAARLPVRPLAELKGVDAAGLAEAAGPGAVFGLVIDGVNYAAPCPTRLGEDPFCDVRDLPSYSTAKTVFGALGLMRLERLLPGAAAETIAAHVEACRAKGGWDDVSLLDALDMATGHYRSSRPEADENAADMAAFFDSETSAEKAAFACGHFPRRDRPGRTWAYHTSDTFLLGLAMADALRRERGAGEDLFDDLVAPVYRRLALSPTSLVTRRTFDAARQPFVGWGLTYHRDDIVRLAQFLQDGGHAGGEDLLDPGLLAEALQRRAPGGGLPTGYPRIIYRHGVWARDVAPLIGCPRAAWTPFMSGYGGISVVMFAPDIVFYAFGDEDHFDWGEAAVQADRLRRLCR